MPQFCDIEVPLETIRHIVRVLQDSGAVDYSPRDGVTCPVCCSTRRPGENMGVTRSHGWTGNSRVRNHKCQVCGARFQSVEVLG